MLQTLKRADIIKKILGCRDRAVTKTTGKPRENHHGNFQQVKPRIGLGLLRALALDDGIRSPLVRQSLKRF